ncbi:hypothetical protein [Paenibacillus qinlingensis]|uniref:hypothetical protein n=1 Tax=Paenibacillus qinlingensis TaxID=1837343 RepID=UPI00156452B1|nr:hypothetical protein [Paenibacillus qinlingensis]NQX60543.1 hypothetical protein [Paenibacillus qinlingensis]
MTRGTSVRRNQENKMKDGRGQGLGKDYIPLFKLVITRFQEMAILLEHLAGKLKEFTREQVSTFNRKNNRNS